MCFYIINSLLNFLSWYRGGEGGGAGGILDENYAIESFALIQTYIGISMHKWKIYEILVKSTVKSTDNKTYVKLYEFRLYFIIKWSKRESFYKMLFAEFR